MTVLQLKRSMDARFRRVDTRFRRVDERFDRLEKRFDGLENRFDGLELRFEGMEQRFDRLEKDLRRHFDVVAGSLHDDFRMFAEAIGLQTERLDDHESRLRRLERR